MPLALALSIVVLTASARFTPGASGRPSGGTSPPFTTTQTFLLAAGPAERRFTLRERSGVILLSRLTVPVGVRAYVDAVIPHLAGTRFSTGPANDPALKCRTSGAFVVCMQSQEWCPMPAAAWQLHLVKQSGPAGQIRVDYLVGQPSTTSG
jgi:hypothetical protein